MTRDGGPEAGDPQGSVCCFGVSEPPFGRAIPHGSVTSSVILPLLNISSKQFFDTNVSFGWDVCCGDIEAPEVGIPQGSRDEGTGGVAVERAMPALPPL